MKKILTSLIIITSMGLSANASTQVFYGNTGTPSNATYGGIYNRSINNFGYNAGFTPQNIRRREAIERAKRHEDQYYNGLEKGRTININLNNKNDNINNNMQPIVKKTEEQQQTETTQIQDSDTKSKSTKKWRHLNKKPITKNGVKYY